MPERRGFVSIAHARSARNENEISRAARDSGWQERDAQGRRLNRTLGFAHLGGATLDNEENYLIKKFFSAMGAVQIENQARI